MIPRAQMILILNSECLLIGFEHIRESYSGGN